MVLMSVSMPLLLAGCNASDKALTTTPQASSVQIYLPLVPSDVRTCFKSVVQLDEKDWTRTMVVETIAKLRQSERRKNECGKRLIQFYDDVASKLKATKL